MEKLFIYGTLRSKKVQKKAIGRTIRGKKTSLDKYKKIRLGKYFVIKSGKDEVSGEIIKVTASELKAIDKYEGKQYKRKRILINKAKTWTYVKA